MAATRTKLKGYAKKAGRGLVAFVLVIIALRGLTAIATTPTKPAGPTKVVEQRSQWPDDAARAYAMDFARTYFSYNPKHPGFYEQDLESFVSTNLGARVVPTWGEKAPAQVVQATAVSDETTTGSQRALITVAVTMQANGRAVTRYLGVPVETDKNHGLVVYALPSLTSAPLVATPNNDDLDQLSPDESSDILDVVNRFFTAYLAGDADAVSAGPALPGAQLGASPVVMKLVQVNSVGLLAPAKGRERQVYATVTAKEDDASYSLGYRLVLVKGDRWYVAKVNEGDK
jgi:hypothetical protein